MELPKITAGMRIINISKLDLRFSSSILSSQSNKLSYEQNNTNMRFFTLTILTVASVAFASDFKARPFNEAPHCAVCPLVPQACTVRLFLQGRSFPHCSGLLRERAVVSKNSLVHVSSSSFPSRLDTGVPVNLSSLPKRLELN